MTPVVGIEVIYLYVSDLERSLAFYRDLLGIPMESCPYDPGWAEARVGGVRFALHRAHGSAKPLPNTVRVSFRVDDVAVATARLQRAGGNVGEVRHEVWGTLCEVRDPDGYEIGLFAPPAADLKPSEDG